MTLAFFVVGWIAPQTAWAGLPGGGGGGDAPIPKTYYEQGILVRSGEVIEALGPNLMGDSINEYSGGLEFTQMDVSLPGNNALPVAVGRHRAVGVPQTNGNGLFGDWDLDLPRLHTIATQAEPNWYGANNKTNYYRCSQFNYPPWTYAYVAGGSLSYNYNAFWDGAHLYVPGSGEQTLLKRDPAVNQIYPSDGSASTYPVVTKSHWQLKCLSSLDNGPGEGFEARAPDGTRYRFDHMVIRSWPTAIVAGINQGVSGSGGINRIEVSILPTFVIDRFGNWVRYTYTGTDGWRVASISSSEGRMINFSYGSSGNRIQSINDGTRTWSYAYNSKGSLQTVTQPDGSQWQFTMDSVSWSPFHMSDPDCESGENGTIDQTAQTLTITHPSGAIGSFTLKATYHGRSNVPGSQSTCGLTTNPVSRYFVSRSLSSKTLSGPGMPAMTWSYAYSIAYGSFAPCNGCVSTKTVTITDPSNKVAVKTFGTRYGIDEGLLVASTEGRSGEAPLRSTTYSYAASNAGPYPTSVGTFNSPADSMSRIYTPQSGRVILQQGVRFSSVATGSAEFPNGFDRFARQTGASQTSSPGSTRMEFVGYYDHTALWILGQVASRITSGLVASSTSFYTATGLPSATYKFGKLQASYAFNTDGTLSQIIDPLNHATTFAEYVRGLPGKITYADGTSISAMMDNIGAIRSVTNEAGAQWLYTYDAIGRIASASPPGGYNTKYFSFTQIPAPEYGIEANHWRQTITQGSAVTQNFFDARWRKRMTLTFDNANPAATQRMQSFAYDSYNRTTFASYPARYISSIANVVPGTATVYEPLGRIDKIVAESELGPLTTTYRYLDNFQKQVTNPRGFATTTAYQVFDEPEESSIVSISAPEGVNVNISRDVFGKPLAITRSGMYAGALVSVTRSYVYDGYQQLCKTVEPETGATIQQFDAANNVSWRATGLSLPSLSSCDAGSVQSWKIVAYTYDARNRLTGTGFGDQNPSIGRAYTLDGLPASVVSGDSTWIYEYDAGRLLRTERLTYGPTYSIGRRYTGNMHLDELTYPDGGVVNFGANALGEATRAGGFATGVSYHPNGAVAGYTLGNGIAHTLSQNARGLPYINSDSGVLQDKYTYDAAGNIASIEDLQEGINGRSMSYDGLDRLFTANAPGVWGNATYGYDPLNNIRTSTVGSRSSLHLYVGTANRLTSIVTNGVSTAYGYDVQGNVSIRGAQSFYFDIANRMAASNVASYAYDGFGRRTAIRSLDGTYQVQVYSHAGQLLYGTRQNGMSTSTTRYVYLAGKAIAQWNSVTGTTYLHSDALGSPIAMTSPTATLLSRTRYEPYGKTAAGTVPSELGFTGHVNDANNGLVYMQQRYYDPMAARFISVDPIVTNASTGELFDRYEYANNNPYRYVDSDGRYSNCGTYIQGCTTYWISGGSGGAVIQNRDIATSESSKSPANSAPPAADEERLRRLRAIVAGLVNGTKDFCPSCDRASFNRMTVVASSLRAIDAGFAQGTLASYSEQGNIATFYREFFALINPAAQAGTIFHEYQHSLPGNIDLVKNSTAAERSLPHNERPWEKTVNENETLFVWRYSQTILDQMR